MGSRPIRAFQALLIGVSCATASGDTSIAAPRSGSYSLRLLGLGSKEVVDENGDKLPSCGDEGRSVFDSMSKLTLVFNAAKGTAIVKYAFTGWSPDLLAA